MEGEAGASAVVDPRSPISVRRTDHAGRGVFAERALAPGELIETSHCIRIPQGEYDVHGQHTVLSEYCFAVGGGGGGGQLLALGLGSLFNHSREPNVDYRVHGGAGGRDDALIRYYVGHKPVQQGEELCIYYGPDEKLWFEMPPLPAAGESSDEDEDEDGGGDEDEGGGVGISADALSALREVQGELDESVQRRIGSLKIV